MAGHYLRIARFLLCVTNSSFEDWLKSVSLVISKTKQSLINMDLGWIIKYKYLFVPRTERDHKGRSIPGPSIIDSILSIANPLAIE